MTQELATVGVHSRLSDICDFITKGSTPTTYGYAWQDTGILFLRSECVSPNGLDLGQSKFISEEANKSLRRSQIIDGDILMTITGNVGRVVRLRGVGVANINQHIARIRVRNSTFDPDYVYHYLSQSRIKANYESITTGQAYPQLSLAQVRDTVLEAPRIDEQKAVANALNDVDALISSLEKLIDKKHSIKQGMMHELLTGKTRLPGFSKEWEKVRLGDLGRTYGGLTGKSGADFGSGNAEFITFTEVMANIQVDGTRTARVHVREGERQNAVRVGDLLFNGSSETPDELALCSAVISVRPDTYLNSFCFGFRPRSGSTLDPHFLAYLFRGTPGRSLLQALAQGAIRYNLSKSRFRELTLLLPEVEEQSRIAQYLRDADVEITTVKKRLVQVRLMKQGMMQGLLTGRTRLRTMEPSA